MATQKALLVHAPGAHGKWTIEDIPVPTPAKGEVLIKILSSAMNPMDWMRPVYDILIEKYPAIMGGDIAGTIQAVGEGVTDFAKGDRVMFSASEGGFQQYVTIKATGILIRIPDNTSFDDASTFPVTFCTACVGLFAPAPIGLGLNPTFSWDQPQKGKSALVLGASTSVGQYAVQLLKFLGFERIVAYASESNFSLLETLGATHCIDRNIVSVADLSSSPAVSPGVDVAYVIYGEVNEVYDSVVDGGKMTTSNPRAVLTREGKSVDFCFHVGNYYGLDVLGITSDIKGAFRTPEHSAFGRLIIENLPKMLGKKAIIPSNVEILPNGLDGIMGGIQRLKERSVSAKKLVSHPHDA